MFYGLQTGGYLFFSWLSFGSPVALVPALLDLPGGVRCVRPAGGRSDLPPAASGTAAGQASSHRWTGVHRPAGDHLILRFGGNGQSAPNVIGGGVVHLFKPVSSPTTRFILAAIVAIVAGACSQRSTGTRGLAWRLAPRRRVRGRPIALAGMSANELSGDQTRCWGRSSPAASAFSRHRSPSLIRLKARARGRAGARSCAVSELHVIQHRCGRRSRDPGGVIESLLVYLSKQSRGFPRAGGNRFRVWLT